MRLPVCILIISFWICCNGIGQSIGNPPGTLPVNDTMFADAGEVTNAGWREYLSYLINRKDSSAFLAALPMRGTFPDDGSIDEWHRHTYRYPSYNLNPITGISYEQAVNFCSWRTRMANLLIYFRKHKIKKKKVYDHMDDSIPILFYYRLPTKAEWEMIAIKATETKKGGNDSINCNYAGVSFIMGTSSSFFTQPAPLPMIRFYHLLGNVAEMVAERNIAKGGSYMDDCSICTIKNDTAYTQPDAWLGFRCVAIIFK